MKTTSSKQQSVNKIITFSPVLYANALKTANQKGITFQEYIRHLLVKDMDDQTVPQYMVDEETEKGIAEGLEDYKNGRYTRVKASDIQSYLDSLKKSSN